jgi:hypothetical protein
MSNERQTPIVPYTSIPFVHEWRIRRTTVYRYLEQEYVDLFLNEGKLRISSFSQFAKHPDEQRRDDKEGWGIVNHTNSVVNDGKGMTMMAVFGMGGDSYVLCGSTLYNAEARRRFGETGFIIRDSISFAHAVSAYIPGFRFGYEGPCTYVDSRLVERDAGNFTIDDLKVSPDSNDIAMDKVMATVAKTAGDDLLFQKPERYAHELEYRLLWITGRRVEGYIDIVCPEASQFCEPFG